LKAKSVVESAESVQRRRKDAVLHTSDRVGREAGSVGESFLSQLTTAPQAANMLAELPRELLFRSIVL
jgi:hypothetical protein